MRWKELVIGLSTLLVTSPLLATTYFGGFEDSAGSSSDYDFNDLVYSVSGSNLTLHTATGSWFNQSAAGVLNTNSFQSGTMGTPFWNNTSQDGSGGYNVGWCIWGGGACNGGVGLSPGAQYLATSTGGSVNDVYFSTNGSVTEQVTLAVALKQSALGWELTSGVGGVHLFSTGVEGPLTFTPGGDFILVGQTFAGVTYDSNVAASDGFSHFAFFTPSVSNAAPEPSTIGLLGLTLLGFGLTLRKRIARA